VPDDDLELLMALRLQGVSPAERAAVATGIAVEDVQGRLAGFVDNGLATERTGRVAGFTLSPGGAEALDKLLAAEGLHGDAELLDAYDRFLLLNQRVLRVCSDWQVRREGGVEEPNDHSDPSYDAAVIDRVAELNGSARTWLERVAERAPRYASYRARLDDCVERLLAGDGKAFTAPLAESYHTVWFELHQDLLLTLGLERES
jgi:hypothetical protein